MPTGLNIRDFTKVYRELRYANEGAIRLSEVEHNAYLNRLTIEITHYDAYRSVNYKSNPETTHWGYCTAFKGSSVISNQPIKFVKQRVFEGINQGIWNYHEATESVKLSVAATESGVNSLIAGGVLGGATGALISLFVEAVEGLENVAGPALAWLVGSEQAGENEGGGSGNSYTAYPITSPFPDVFKFKSDVPVSFLFRLESWYLVNPSVYAVSNPTDTSDETEGEDEYPEPEAGDGNGDSQDFPESSPNDPENDPRDGGQKPEPPIDPSANYVWSGTFSGVLLGGSGSAENYTASVTFTTTGNQFPFTAKAGASALIVRNGETFYNGLEVYDRFEQLIGTFYQGTGFRDGAHTITVTPSVSM